MPQVFGWLVSNLHLLCTKCVCAFNTQLQMFLDRQPALSIWPASTGLGVNVRIHSNKSSGTGSALEKIPKVVIACSAVDTAILLPVRVFTIKHDSDVCCMQVLTMVNNQHYLYRMTVLVAITSLASVVSHETLYQTILPAVVSCAKDKVICQSQTFLKQLCVEHAWCQQMFIKVACIAFVGSPCL